MGGDEGLTIGQQQHNASFTGATEKAACIDQMHSTAFSNIYWVLTRPQGSLIGRGN